MADTATPGTEQGTEQTTEQTTQQTREQGTEQGNDPAGKAFTQEDVDRIVAERLARESRKHESALADLKAQVEALSGAKAGDKGGEAVDVDKAVADAKAEVEKALKSEFARERVLDKIEVAAAGKFADVEDARLRLAQRADEFVAEDGSVNVEAITKAVDETLDKHPHLRAQAPTPSASRAGIGVVGDGKVQPPVSPGLDRLAHAYAQTESSK